MIKRVVTVTGVVLALVVAACSGDLASGPSGADGGTDATAAPPTSGGLPCDVDAVLAKSCRSCHSATPSYGAPMPLVTLADLQAPAKSNANKKVYELVGTRIHDDAAPMPQPPNARLDAKDTATLDTWIAGGAQGSTAQCAATDAGTSPGVSPLSCTPDQRIRPTSKFAMTDANDLYVCYGFDTTSATKRHVIAGAAHIDNPKIVHHVLLYQAESAVSGTPTPCGAGGGSNWRLVTGWAPGGKNFDLPPEAGFAEEAGVTHWALQIHYNNTLGYKGEVDESGFDLCSTDVLRPNDADILATGTVGISIPPRTAKHRTECELTMPADYGTLNLVSSWAHMHRLGRAQSAVRVRGGAETTILDAPTYDFSVGGGASSIKVDVGPGDKIRTMCQWQNTSDRTVTFGEGTDDEMCFAFLTYWPKITKPGFRWMVPSLPLVSKCTSTDE